LSELDPAKPPPSVIERAYQLAGSGRCANVEEICRELHREGYRELYQNFDGAALRADLARICREAQGLSAPPTGGKPVPKSAMPSSARRFDLKAAECRQLADNAQHPQTRQIYIRLALSYERLAEHAKENERHDSAGQKSSNRAH